MSERRIAERQRLLKARLTTGRWLGETAVQPRLGGPRAEIWHSD
jgi:hypothetical protein